MNRLFWLVFFYGVMLTKDRVVNRSSMESTETTTVQSEGSEEFFGGGGDGADFFSGGGSMGGSSTGEALGGQTGNVDMKWSHHSPGLVTMTTVDVSAGHATEHPAVSKKIDFFPAVGSTSSALLVRSSQCRLWPRAPD